MGLQPSCQHPASATLVPIPTAQRPSPSTHLVLEGRAQEEVHNLVLLHRQREQVDLLQALDLALQQQQQQSASGAGTAQSTSKLAHSTARTALGTSA